MKCFLVSPFLWRSENEYTITKIKSHLYIFTNVEAKCSISQKTSCPWTPYPGFTSLEPLHEDPRPEKKQKLRKPGFSSPPRLLSKLLWLTIPFCEGQKTLAWAVAFNQWQRILAWWKGHIIQWLPSHLQRSRNRAQGNANIKTNQ